MRAPLLFALLVGAACIRETPVPADLLIEPGAGAIGIRLVPRPGWRINALLPPAFEGSDGSIVRLTADSLTADSAYYLVPPAATLPGTHRTPRGTVRASVCAVGEQVCRPYVKEVAS